MKSKTRENLLDDSEIERLKKAAKDPAEHFLVWTLLYTGMRISELIHMRADWIDWRREIIIIPESQSCICPECSSKGGVWRPKTKRSARAIPIVPEISEIIGDFFSRCGSVLAVIPSRVHAYLIIRSLSKKAHIKHNVFPHALRGTFATLLAAKNFTSHEIQALLGWRSAKTADDYIMLSGAQVTRAVKDKW